MLMPIIIGPTPHRDVRPSTYAWPDLPSLAAAHLIVTSCLVGMKGKKMGIDWKFELNDNYHS